MRYSAATVSEREFLSLPPTLQRKLFSQGERLRLAKHGVTTASGASTSHLRRQSTSLLLQQRPRSLFGLPLSVSDEHSSRLQKRSSRAARQTILETSYPFRPPTANSTFIRKHLSPEERLQCTDTGLRPPSSYFPRFDVEDQRSCFGRDDGLVGTEREDGMANYSLDGLGWLEDESELDLDLGHYHTTERAEAPTVATPRRSFRRNLSLSSLRRNSITPLHSQSALSRLNTPSSQYDFKPTSPHGSRFAHRPNESVASVDPRATWINDPAARQKLRNVASAQFGLAVSHTSERGSIERPMTSPRPVQYGGRTFFADDTPSLSNDEGDSQDELETLRDPKTPDEAVFQHDRKRETMINEHISPRPHAVHSYTEPCMRPSPLDDEMTIHMTLTRPDLRSPGNETTAATSSIVQSIAPAQHTASPTMNNSTSIWDSLPPVEESKVRRLWNRLKNR